MILNVCIDIDRETSEGFIRTICEWNDIIQSFESHTNETISRKFFLNAYRAVSLTIAKKHTSSYFIIYHIFTYSILNIYNQEPPRKRAMSTLDTTSSTSVSITNSPASTPSRTPSFDTDDLVSRECRGVNVR